jgi:hypothetical protein
MSFKQDLVAMFDKEMDRLIALQKEEISRLNAAHRLATETLTAEHQAEMSKIMGKIRNYAQTEDTNKFQKRTIASLTAEISTMQGTMTTLEKRLKQASEELRYLKQAGICQAPVSPLEPEPSTVKKSEPVQEKLPVKEEAQEVQETEQVPEEDDEPELIPVVLNSGTYFWDPDTHDLYEYISDEEAGEIVGLIKSVKIKNQIYYLDTTDNNFYEITEDNNIGKRVGQIVDRKAVFKI